MPWPGLGKFYDVASAAFLEYFSSFEVAAVAA
jgi:hypothetical protein